MKEANQPGRDSFSFDSTFGGSAWKERVREDFLTLIASFRPSAEAGDPRAQFQLGMLYSRVVGDQIEAARWYERAAESGDAVAQLEVAELYLSGAGVARDHEAGVRWLWRAAAQGHAAALHRLGILSELGEGVPQDELEACRWYLLAAIQGNEVAYNQFTDLTRRMKPELVSEAHRMAEAFSRAPGGDFLSRLSQ